MMSYNIAVITIISRHLSPYIFVSVYHQGNSFSIEIANNNSLRRGDGGLTLSKTGSSVTCVDNRANSRMPVSKTSKIPVMAQLNKDASDVIGVETAQAALLDEDQEQSGLLLKSSDNEQIAGTVISDSPLPPLPTGERSIPKSQSPDQARDRIKCQQCVQLQQCSELFEKPIQNCDVHQNQRCFESADVGTSTDFETNKRTDVKTTQNRKGFGGVIGRRQIGGGDTAAHVGTNTCGGMNNKAAKKLSPNRIRFSPSTKCESTEYMSPAQKTAISNFTGNPRKRPFMPILRPKIKKRMPIKSKIAHRWKSIKGEKDDDNKVGCGKKKEPSFGVRRKPIKVKKPHFQSPRSLRGSKKHGNLIPFQRDEELLPWTNLESESDDASIMQRTIRQPRVFKSRMKGRIPSGKYHLRINNQMGDYNRIRHAVDVDNFNEDDDDQIIDDEDDDDDNEVGNDRTYITTDNGLSGDALSSQPPSTAAASLTLDKRPVARLVIPTPPTVTIVRRAATRGRCTKREAVSSKMVSMSSTLSPQNSVLSNKSKTNLPSGDSVSSQRPSSAKAMARQERMITIYDSTPAGHGASPTTNGSNITSVATKKTILKQPLRRNPIRDYNCRFKRGRTVAFGYQNRQSPKKGDRKFIYCNNSWKKMLVFLMFLSVACACLFFSFNYKRNDLYLRTALNNILTRIRV